MLVGRASEGGSKEEEHHLDFLSSLGLVLNESVVCRTVRSRLRLKDSEVYLATPLPPPGLARFPAPTGCLAGDENPLY